MRMYRRFCCVIFTLILLGLLLYWNLRNRRLRKKDLARESLTMEFQSAEILTTTSQLSILKQSVITKEQRDNNKAFDTNGDKDSFTPLKMDVLLSKLMEIENKMLPKNNIILIAGSSSSVENNLPFYQPALETLGYSLRQEPSGITMDWAGLLCFADDKDLTSTCIRRSEFGKLKPDQKVSKIAGLQYVLTEPDAFCYSVTAAQDIPSLRGIQLSTTCFVMPAQFDTFTSYIASRVSSSYWLVSELSDKQTMGTFISSKNRVEIERLKAVNVVVQDFTDFLLVSGAPVVLKLYVIVTAISPLRAYIHRHGLVLLMYFKGGVADTWSMEKFYEHLVGSYGKANASVVFNRIKTVIVKTLLVTEPHVALHLNTNRRKNQSRCRHCFQLLEFDCAVRKNSLIPVVLQVHGQPNLQQLRKINRKTSSVGQDTVNLLYNNVLVAKKVLDVLRKAKESQKTVEGLRCETSHEICLREVELEYLIAAKREDNALGGFSKLYPVADGAKYAKILNDLNSLGFNYLPGGKIDKPDNQRTSHFHKMLAAIENLYQHRRDNVSNIWDAIDSDGETRDKRIVTNSQVVKSAAPLQPSSHVKRKCDPAHRNSDPVLAALIIEPGGDKLGPSFNKDVKTYKLEVTFETTIVKIWAQTAFCRFRVQLTDAELKRPLNYSLGIGWNEILLQIVDTSRSVPRVANKYKVHVYRQSRSEKAGKFDTSKPHQVCGLIQECGLRVMPTRPCGLQKLQHNSWKDFFLQRTKLSVCKTGHEQGVWAVPCERCLNSKSCYWRNAIWAPHFCRHIFLTTQNTQSCFSKKKIIFLGDSTNRGMMYYLMEKINGSLTKWDKTHEMRTYKNDLNGGQTSVSFAYYPQFWLPQNKRPGFSNTLHQLIARNLPLENSTNTALVVGGFLWMTPEHIESIRNSLVRLGLNGIKVVLKSYGVGLPLQVPRQNISLLQMLQHVAAKNKLLIEAAIKQDYEVIDTYSITVPRHREFFQGGCRCHFHKVIGVENLNALENGESASRYPVGHRGPFPRYHVIGPINALYSEILINRICS